MKLNTLLSVLSIFVAIINITNAYTINTYNKSGDDDLISPGTSFMLQDGSTLLRFYRPLNNNGRCNEPNLHIKLLHRNGTLSPFTVQNFNVPKYNFCRLTNDLLTSDYIQVTNLGRNVNFYILYYNISDTDQTLPFGRFIIEVDLEGNILGENWLGPASFSNGNIIGRLGKFKALYNAYYYMQLIDIHNPNILAWQKFKIAPITGRLQREESEVVHRDHLSIQYDNPTYSFQTIDNGIGFIYFKNNSQNAGLEPTFYAYVNFFRPEVNNFTEPFIIYQTAVPNIKVKSAMCSAGTLGTPGYQCVLQLTKITNTIQNVDYGHNLVLLISFLSSGSVTSIKQIQGNYASAELVIKLPLIYGGYLLMYRNTAPNSNGNCIIGGDIYDNDDKFSKNWDIPPNFIIQSPCVLIYNYFDKKFDIISNVTPNTFTIVSTDMPKFLNIEDRTLSLMGSRVSSVEPQSGSIVPLGTDLTFTINYDIKVSLSTRNITIYQVNGTDIFIRQTTSSQVKEFCSIDANNRIVTIKVLPSTFNIPDSEYHVSIDPNFVRHFDSNEPIDKLQHSSWILNTEYKEDQFADSFSGSIRLTTDGMKIFNQNKKEFIDNLLQEISSILPVDIDRLSIGERYQTDTSTSSEKLIVPLQIKPTRDLSKRNTDNLRNDLNSMIQYRDFTEISRNQYTSLIDQTYGYKLNVGVKEILLDNKESIIAIIVAVFLITIVILWAKRRNEEGSNMIILKVILSIVDFVLDGLFIYKHGYDIKILFLPSLFILVSVSLFNIISAVSLILFENYCNEIFKEWFKSSSIIASIFTLLSITNIEVLNILSSKFGGFNIFSTTFSAKTETLIFWFSVLNFILKDIPQFGIQVYYKIQVVSYSAIPFLTLVTSSLIIALNLIGRIYNSIIQCQKQSSDDDNNDNNNQEDYDIDYKFIER